VLKDQFYKFIYLYDGGNSKTLDSEDIVRYLTQTLKKAKIELRGEFVTYCISGLSPDMKEDAISSLAVKFAKIKIKGRNIMDKNDEPMLGEIEYEKRGLINPHQKPFGILYNGFELQDIYSSLIPEKETGFNHIHVAFTNQLFGTLDENNLTYHARISVYGFPSIISTTGLVEAPAKPREFYLKKSLGLDPIELKMEFAGKFIDYDDPRLTDVMKGYVMQALFYHLAGEPFCEDKNCRLYNAHWQREVIHAQIEGEYEFCPKHSEILAQF
jgi:hypothetical protein